MIYFFSSFFCLYKYCFNVSYIVYAQISQIYEGQVHSFVNASDFFGPCLSGNLDNIMPTDETLHSCIRSNFFSFPMSGFFQVFAHMFVEYFHAKCLR